MPKAAGLTFVEAETGCTHDMVFKISREVSNHNKLQAKIVPR